MTTLSHEEREKLAGYFNEEAKKELEYADDLKRTSSKSNNIVIKLIIDAVSQDSIKHSKIYEVLSKLIQEPMLISEKESKDVLNDINRHIEEEREAVEELNKLLKNEALKEDKVLKFLIEMLLRDETYHHALLVNIYNVLVKDLTLEEADIWEQIWESSLYHGTPGG